MSAGSAAPETITVVQDAQARPLHGVTPDEAFRWRALA